MASNDAAPFKMLDAEAIAAAPLRRDPYDYCFVEQSIPLPRKMEVVPDLPLITGRGSYTWSQLKGKSGRSFAACMEDLLSDHFRGLVEQKFDVDLSRYPASIVMMGNTTGHYNEGYAHPDSRHKIITVLLGFTAEWPYERGRLRVLRSNDRNDFAFEFAPEFGKMLMFKVCDHSWHGFLAQKGRRMSVELSYVDSEWYAQRENVRHRISAIAKSIPGVGQLLNWKPRPFGKKT